jgi:hypothetical protein
MTEMHHLHRYERIDGSYESVRACFRRFRAAGESAPLVIREMTEQSPAAGLPGGTRVTLGLRDDRGRRHFESAELYASPASDVKTCIEVDCHPIGRAPEPSTQEAVDAHFRALMAEVMATIQRELRSVQAPSSASPGEARPHESAR